MAASLAVEWAPHNIRVNSLSPGYMLTSLTRTILEKDTELKVSSSIGIKREEELMFGEEKMGRWNANGPNG